MGSLARLLQIGALVLAIGCAGAFPVVAGCSGSFSRLISYGSLSPGLLHRPLGWIRRPRAIVFFEQYQNRPARLHRELAHGPLCLQNSAQQARHLLVAGSRFHPHRTCKPVIAISCAPLLLCTAAAAAASLSCACGNLAISSLLARNGLCWAALHSCAVTLLGELNAPFIHEFVPDAHFSPQSCRRDKQLHKLVLHAQFDTSAGEVMTRGMPSQQLFCKKDPVSLAFSSCHVGPTCQWCKREIRPC